MQFLYVLVCDAQEWEDMELYDSEEAAIAASKKHPSMRVEVFKKETPDGSYLPMYCFYRNGELIDVS